MVAFTVFAASTVWFVVDFGHDWLMALPFIAALPMGYYFFWVRRCPECGRRLVSRRESLGSTTTYRWLSRCDHCQIDWDTRTIGDTKYDD